MTRLAIVRAFYSDRAVIQAAIESALAVADAAIIAVAERPWGGVEEVQFFGRRHTIPSEQIRDDTVRFALGLGDPRAKVLFFTTQVTRGYHSTLINGMELYRGVDTMILLESDHVWDVKALGRAVEMFESSEHRCATSMQFELWRPPTADRYYLVPRRRDRIATVFWRGGGPIEPTSPGGMVGDAVLPAFVHNFGFCASVATMFWKHLIAIGMADAIGDSRPDPEWLFRWLSWKPGDTNLEIAMAHREAIPRVVPFHGEVPSLGD